jgi:hypothetical protein
MRRIDGDERKKIKFVVDGIQILKMDFPAWRLSISMIQC